MAQGAIKTAETIEELAIELGLPGPALTETINALPVEGADEFGRHFGPHPLAPPYCGVKVTGALFHTQGGLVTDGAGRVIRRDGRPFPNLFAGGGAACGVSVPLGLAPASRILSETLAAVPFAPLAALGTALAKLASRQAPRPVSCSQGNGHMVPSGQVPPQLFSRSGGK